VLASPSKSKSRLEAENAVLRHQLIVLAQGEGASSVQPTNNDRWFLVQMYRSFPSILKVVTIVEPETQSPPDDPRASCEHAVAESCHTNRRR
jgi:hypothetical protein